MSTPSFAVVGHPNKGKSSIVATLAEDDDIRVSPVPGTTRAARRFALKVDGTTLYELIDTPGFQRSGELLGWLQEQEAAAQSSAAERPGLVARFLEQFGQDERFSDECQLLRPVMDGAGILYVVDGTKPFGAEFEVEMEILRWTGRPRMALINMIGSGNYVDQWRDGLGQYFSIVRQFDAMRADFAKRSDLLRAFAELDETWKPSLQRAITALETERDRRLRQSAAEIAQLLSGVLTATETAQLDETIDREQQQERLIARLKQRVSRTERRSRDRIEDLYRHFHLDREDSTSKLMATDLFAGESWQVFGLSRQQLIVTGALSGAVAGSGLDLLLGGASLMLGAGVGAAIGSVGAWLGASEIAKVKILGQALGGPVLQVGPVHDANFPWVVLGRASLHQRLVSERNHARREAIAVDAQQAQHYTDSIAPKLRRELQACFTRLNKNPDYPGLNASLTAAIEAVLRAEGAHGGEDDNATDEPADV